MNISEHMKTQKKLVKDLHQATEANWCFLIYTIMLNIPYCITIEQKHWLLIWSYSSLVSLFAYAWTIITTHFFKETNG